MKKITWLTTTSFIDVDHQIVPELAKTFKIHWVIFGGAIIPPAYNDLVRLSNENGIEIEYYTIKEKWYSPTRFFSFGNLLKYAIGIPSDIIYIDAGLTFWDYYAALHILPREKTVLATHNVKTPKGARLEHFARYFMGQTLKNFQNFHVFSKNQGEYLEYLVGKGKNVLYAPLTLKDYGKKGERTKYKDIVNFLSFGHIRHYKRIDILIEAAQKLYEETKAEFKVSIAGNCPGWSEYAKMIKYPDLFDLHIGFIEDDEVADYFANADYLVLPYQDLAQSGAITVAFNYNIPVITSDIIQFCEFVEDGYNGFLFETENVDALVSVMKKAIEMGHNDKYAKLVETSTRFVEDNYALSSIADKYIQYFNKF